MTQDASFSLLGLLMALWIAAGVADWWCHRRTHIEATSGLAESAFHWALFLQMGAAVLAALLLRPTAALVAFLLAMWALHEVATWLELRRVAPVRTITPLEQMVHSFMEILPLAGVMLLCQPALTAWLQAPDSERTLDWRWLPRETLPPWPVLAGYAVAIAVCNGGLLAEESWRCWRTARAGRRR
ncbi:hypothetical protein [Acidovorax sp. NCPPB 4044]|uniref:hypothetical protein n=1 Tax=Acidovorax sp. NCPPB 4044 TaxID=2940490 RepID=UPI0023044D55|nr:hypothetical protein [Acidovorax sp. NCPPB 4044]MDA8522133.1 hypothetical protein [Acidovorax sp. NCPPB 4044]